MDVERIQRVNNLALDLMKQGLASSRDDAISQAERIFSGDKGTTAYHEMRQTLGEVEAHKKEEYSAMNPQSQDTYSNTDIPAYKIKEILEQNTKFIVKTFKEHGDKIQALEQELAQLRRKVSSERLPTVSELVSMEAEKKAAEPQVQQSAPRSEPRPAPEPVQQPQATPKPENHPRVGAFTETDVSIEKFFYYGN
ncbi:hypothetical protein HQ489_04580 [Candidatus Woesearchaeota archaeon]|nr:hypothetical protein [Candidatus Woesearchaeota archaeon]